MIESADNAELREQMVAHQIKARGVRSPRVLDAMLRVRREGYVPSYLGEFAYDDTPLPIEEEQTISQPFIVGAMLEALELRGDERVLEVGTGSGYAAAILAEISAEVFTIERHARLARTATERLRRDGYHNVHVRTGDGTLGWPEEAPFDAIVVAAGGPEVPESLREQLAVGGRMVIPIGEAVGYQDLVRVTRLGHDDYHTEHLAEVRFVPLIGAEGWRDEAASAGIETPPTEPKSAVALVAECAEPFEDLEHADLGPLLDRIGDSRVVLLGEASHGTSEFYRMRARITRALVEHKGFRIVAAEADWPDAAQIDHYIRDLDVPAAEWQAFARFPTWMWRNHDVRDYVDWQRDFNAGLPHGERVRFAGLDLYALFNSIFEVLRHLDRVEPEVAAIARQRYGCLTPWQSDPAAYGRAALTGEYRSCEAEVVSMLQDLFSQRLGDARAHDEHVFDAIQNARLVADAEAYYRGMYYGAAQSWNLRDQHMFQTLLQLLEFHGPRSKAVVWAHNSHIGDAAATEMSARGEYNIGQLCRERFGNAAYSVGFGTDHGSVAAASYWDGPMEYKPVRPSCEGSYERLCHETGHTAFFLPLRSPASVALRRELANLRLERAIGVIYRPETERASHYFHAALPHQFDEWIWFDRSDALRPLETHELAGVPDTYPFGL